MSMEEDADDEARERFTEIVTHYSSECAPLELYGDYLAGNTSFESIEEKFGEGTTA
jgi:hypothetical protein